MLFHLKVRRSTKKWVIGVQPVSQKSEIIYEAETYQIRCTHSVFSAGSISNWTLAICIASDFMSCYPVEEKELFKKTICYNGSGVIARCNWFTVVFQSQSTHVSIQ